MKIITRLEIYWALFYFMLSVLWIYFEKRMGWHDAEIDKHAAYSILFVIPAVIVFWLAILHKRHRHYHGSMTWRQGFDTGLGITIVVMLLTPLTQIIFHKYISPQYFPNMVTFSTTVEGRNQHEMEAFFSLFNFIILAMIDAFIWGVVASAVVSFILRRRKQVEGGHYSRTGKSKGRDVNTETLRH